MIRDMGIASITYDDATDVITFHLADTALPDPPAGVDPDRWHPQAGSIRVSAPMRRGVVTGPHGIYTDDNADYWLVTLLEGAWTDPVQVDHMGQPVDPPPG
jgi:hypothetical protein